MSLLIDNVTNSLLLKSMEVCLEKQKIIAGNIANATLPEYKAMQVDDGNFESILQGINEAGAASPEKTSAIDSLRVPELLQVSSTGAPVALDVAMLDMSKNVTHYQSLLALKKGYVDMIGLAIKGDRQ